MRWFNPLWNATEGLRWCSANLKKEDKQEGKDNGHEQRGQHVYLEPWNNEEVESMLLGMELFLLVRHTHPPLRTEMEDIHTQKHIFTQPQSYWWRTDGRLVQTHGRGGFSDGKGRKNRMLHYLTMDDFSQGLLRVSEKKKDLSD